MTMMTRETQAAIADRRDNTMVKDRRGRRAEMSCRLFFFGNDDFEGEGTLLDISTSGCRASSPIEVQPGMLLKLSVFLPDYLWPLRVDEAMVRWVNGQEFGVEFTGIRLAQRERLRALVMKEKP
jgi:PilZ domain-containing protein